MSTNPSGAGALARKLAKILGAVGQVKKTGRNSYHNYDYVTENDLVYEVRGKLADSNIMVFTSVDDQRHDVITTKDGDKRLLVSVSLTHTFIDGDSGEMFSVKSQGQGADNDDKGIYKATTGAMKYFLYKCFMIPTGDDPERDDRAPTGGDRQSQEDIERSRERQQDRGGSQAPGPADWRSIRIHFGTSNGKLLTELTDRDMEFWASWKPKPFNQRIDPRDTALRKGLDELMVERTTGRR